MRWLLRTITRRNKGATAHWDEGYRGDALTIGRGTDQALFLSDLRVALEHAKVTQLRGGRYRVTSMLGAGVKVDGKTQQTAIATIGSNIELGDQNIRFITPPAGYDAALEITKVKRSPDQVKSSFADADLSLGDTWLGRRKPSWFLFVVILIATLIIPLAGNMMPGLQQQLRNMPLPDDGQWEAGTLQSAHHYFGEDCSTCHTVAFKKVMNEACETCHTHTAAHADPEVFSIIASSDNRCAACHRDHNGKDGLIRDDQKLCQDCHQDLQHRTAKQTLLADASDFTDNHPQFKVEVAAWDASGHYAPRRESLDSDTLIEHSNLHFPHDLHLNPAGIASPTGQRILNCDACHGAEPGGAKMMPVKFETMCQDCHRLTFDLQAPDREVPHGKVPEVLYMLDDYYAGRALAGGYDEAAAPAVVRTRRRPGQRMSRAQTREALAWAREKSRAVGRILFIGQACGVCHLVEAMTEGSKVNWIVKPVRVAGVWLPKAKFTHNSHTTMSCESCHNARQSGIADDVLIPGIENCRVCHTGADHSRLIQSTCVSCHQYHIWAGPKAASQ